MGVAGIGGLGQMGVRLAVAMGNRVTAISSSPSKREAVLELGAKEFVDSTSGESLAKANRSLDLILNTISADHQVMSRVSLKNTA